MFSNCALNPFYIYLDSIEKLKIHGKHKKDSTGSLMDLVVVKGAKTLCYHGDWRFMDNKCSFRQLSRKGQNIASQLVCNPYITPK